MEASHPRRRRLSHIALAEDGVLELVAFKGGTAFRMVYARARGRFSTAIDCCVANLTDDSAEVQALIQDAIDEREIGLFRYTVE